MYDTSTTTPQPPDVHQLLRQHAEPLHDLPSTVNAPKVERRIRAAFRIWWAARTGQRRPKFDTFHEHGHWWVRVSWRGWGCEEHTYDAVDAEGGDAVDGFSFEEV